MSLFDRVSPLLVCGMVSVLPVQLSAQSATSTGPKDIAHALNEAYTSVYEKVAPAVVVIDVEKEGKLGTDMSPMPGFDFFFRGPKGESEQPDQSEGSGFVIRPDGYIVTNSHVIDGADKINVKLKDGRSLQAKLVGTDERTDIAVLKVEEKNLPTVEFANSDQVKVGQLVCAIGTPYKFAYTFTTGVVSAKGRNDLLADKYEDYIQTDTSINPGNSGGPLCDIDGRVIGVNTLIHGLNHGLGFAISRNMAKQISDQLISAGKIIRPWLGIMIESLNDQNRSDLFKGIEKGVVVRTIQADTPAAKSDLRPADVITDVDGVAVTSARELQNEVLKKEIGASVTLGVWRDGKKMTVAIRTEASPTDANRIGSNAPPKPEGQADNQNFGLQVQDVTPQLKQDLELKADSGVVITDIVPNSPAAVADIRPGDVITEVDRVPVNNTEAFRRALAGQKGKSNLLLLLDRKGVKTYSIVKAK